MWRRFLIAACLAAAGSLATAVPSTGAPGAGAPGYLNPALVQVGQVPGQIVDVSQTQILYLGGSASQVALEVLDRANGQTVTVPAVPERHPVWGWLVPGGVVFSAEGADVTTDRLYEWDGGADVTDLGALNSSLSVVVRGSYVIWNDGMTLYRRDLATGQTVVVATDAGNWNNDLLPTGDVVYWTEGSYRILGYQDGQTEQVSPDTPGMWNVYPITDGSNVVYQKGSPCCAGSYSIVLDHGGIETQLTSPSTFEPVPGSDYEVAGGWTAFQQPSSTGSTQTWLRDPDGTTSHLPDIAPAGGQVIDAMNAAGQVMYSAGQSLYLGQAGRPPVLLASGNGVWQTRRMYGSGTPVNFAAYLGQQWYLAIGDSLYVLSTQPLVTLSITVQGHLDGFIALRSPGDQIALVATCGLPPGSHPGVRELGGAPLERKDLGIADHAVADLGRQADGLVAVPGVGPVHHGTQVREQRLADFPGGGVP